MSQRILQNQMEEKMPYGGSMLILKNYKCYSLYRKAFKIVSESLFFFFFKGN